MTVIFYCCVISNPHKSISSESQSSSEVSQHTFCIIPYRLQSTLVINQAINPLTCTPPLRGRPPKLKQCTFLANPSMILDIKRSVFITLLYRQNAVNEGFSCLLNCLLNYLLTDQVRVSTLILRSYSCDLSQYRQSVKG